jgi:MFS family permease
VLLLRGFRALRVVPLLLVSFAFFDEFASGVPAAAAFAVQQEFGSGVTSVTFAVLVAPQVLSLGLEPMLVLWAGRRRRPTALGVALGGMALSLGLAALARDLSSFGLAFALYAPASGVALGLAEASLMDQRPSEREQALTQWTLAGTLGDLAAPLRSACVASALWSYARTSKRR